MEVLNGHSYKITNFTGINKSELAKQAKKKQVKAATQQREDKAGDNGVAVKAGDNGLAVKAGAGGEGGMVVGGDANNNEILKEATSADKNIVSDTVGYGDPEPTGDEGDGDPQTMGSSRIKIQDQDAKGVGDFDDENLSVIYPGEVTARHSPNSDPNSNSKPNFNPNPNPNWR